MSRIPWCVLLMMVNDQGKLKETEAQEEESEVIDNEQEELKFLGLA